MWSRTRPCCGDCPSCTCARCWSGWRLCTSWRFRPGRRGYRTGRRSRPTRRGTPAIRSRPAGRARGQRAEGHHRHKKQTGGAGQFGEVFLRVEPLARGAGFEFVDQVKGGVIPYQFIPAVEKGVREVLAHGHAAGYPMQDVRVIVYDGKHHPVDSKEVAFVAAGRKAFLDAIEKARPIVLEPIVSLEGLCPESNMGDVAGDLSSRRGQVTGTKSLQAGTLTVDALAPLSELEGYAARLK